MELSAIEITLTKKGARIAIETPRLLCYNTKANKIQRKAKILVREVFRIGKYI